MFSLLSVMLPRIFLHMLSTGDNKLFSVKTSPPVTVASPQVSCLNSYACFSWLQSFGKLRKDCRSVSSV